MKKLMISSILLVVSIVLFGKNGINFEHKEWDEILEKSKKEHKLIFVDAFATWCGPCKDMTKNIFPDKSVGEFYNANFINFKIDMESKAGKNFNKIYSIESYPSLMFIDSDGNVVKKQEGSCSSPEQFIQLGNYVLHPEKSPTFIAKKEYNGGKRDRKFLIDYFILLALNEEDPSFLIEEYNTLYKMNSLEIEEDLFMYCLDKDNSSFDNKLTKDFLINSEKYSKSTLLNQYDLFSSKNEDIFNFNLSESIVNENKVLLDKTINFLKEKTKDNFTKEEWKEKEKEIKNIYKEYTKG